jgi:peptidoglycan/LPS O-acetylase OafA/YrhL
MLTLAAVLRAGDPTQLRSVLVEPLEAGAFAVLVARTVTGFDGGIGRFLSLPGLVFAGRISYGLYIYHALVAIVFNRWLPSPLRFMITNPSLRLMVFGMATVAVAAVSWRLLEQPMNRFRSKRAHAVLRPAAIAVESDHKPVPLAQGLLPDSLN